MKRFGCLGMLIVLLVVVTAYNWYATVQLRNSVRAISAKVHGTDSKSGAGKGSKDLVTVLAGAENHTRRARKYISENRPAQARAELDKALAELESARDLSTGIAGDVGEFLGNAREKTEAVVRKAWKDISEEVKSKKKK